MPCSTHAAQRLLEMSAVRLITRRKATFLIDTEGQWVHDSNLENISASSYSSIHEQGNPVADGSAHRSYHVQGGRAVVQLPAPMVGQHKAINTSIHSTPSIFWAQYTLHCQLRHLNHMHTMLSDSDQQVVSLYG